MSESEGNVNHKLLLYIICFDCTQLSVLIILTTCKFKPDTQYAKLL